MIVSKGIKFGTFIRWTGPHFLWLMAYTGGIALLYHFDFISAAVPWLPVSVIGTAVAFYVGFKNNQAYDRMWEARKIWGGIVNESRTWGMMADTYISDFFTTEKVDPAEIRAAKKRLIYRHIGWLYTHRCQLLNPTSWEHISQGGLIAMRAGYLEKKFGIGLIDDEVIRRELSTFVPDTEHERLVQNANTATQIINEQARDLAKLRERGLTDDFRHTQMTGVLQKFYTLQGKNERIKKFPLPRQYANMSNWFIAVFIILLPFSMVPELAKIGQWGFWLSIPLTALIGWVYVMMEIVGDYSENPFQRMANDIPMLALCRTIEIDLREMLGETDLPPAIEAKNDILM